MDGGENLAYDVGCNTGWAAGEKHPALRHHDLYGFSYSEDLIQVLVLSWALCLPHPLRRNLYSENGPIRAPSALTAPRKAMHIRSHRCALDTHLEVLDVPWIVSGRYLSDEAVLQSR